MADHGLQSTRRGALTGLLGASGAVALFEPEGAAAAGAQTVSKDRLVVNAVRIYTGKDGNSHAEAWPLRGKAQSNYHIANDVFVPEGFRIFFDSDAVHMTILSGPPNMRLPAHNTPSGSREMFIVLQGAARSIFASGEFVDVQAGTIVFIEDANGTGHAVTSGPEGYTALNVRLAGG